MLRDQNLKKCEKCGAEFGCEAETAKHCWCFDYSLSEKALREVREKYNDCLCPNCLKSFNSPNETLK